MIRFFKSSATFLILSTLLVGCTASEASPLKFSNTLPVVTNSSNDYVNELLERMTLDEKLAQISCIWFDKKKVIDTDGSFNPVKMKLEFPHGIGCFARPQDTQGMEAERERTSTNDSTVVRSLTGRNPSNTAQLINTIQKMAY